MSEAERNGLDDFLQHTEKRIRELKVILWLPPEASMVEMNLAQARVRHMIELLRAHKIPYEILTLRSMDTAFLSAHAAETGKRNKNTKGKP